MTAELIPTIIAVVLVATVGSAIQRITGFGFGIFAMIFLSHLLEVYGCASALSGLLAMVSTVIVAVSYRKYIHWKNILFPAIGFAVISVPSVMVMKKVDNNVLIIMLGVVLILMSAYFLFFSSKIKIKPTPFAGLIAGGCSGVLGGIFSMGGPPVVVYYMQSEGDDKNRYLGTIQAYFLFSNIYSSIVKAANGFVTRDVLILLPFGAIGMVAGILIGRAIFKHLNPLVLRRIVYGFMAVAGVVNIVTALI